MHFGPAGRIDEINSVGIIVCAGRRAVVRAAGPGAGNDVADGHKYFVRYCASCHGTDGLGDGPVAKSLVTPPANLRKLGDKYGMPLPAHKIAEFIDGRDTARAHGSHEMPVWGEKLYEMGRVSAASTESAR